MEILLIALLPVTFLALAGAMIVVSQVSGFLTFVRYSARQRRSNRVISDFIARMALAQRQLARRSRELGQLSSRLAASNSELERLSSMKSRFLSMAAHDVRHPMATIRGYADLLTSRPLGDRERRYVDGIQVASSQVTRLVSDLTDLAIVEAGKLKMDKAPFDVGGLLGDLMATFSVLANQAGVNLHIEAPPAAAVIVGDRFRLGQVLSNLLGNALKFTPAGGRVELRAVPASGGVLFTVSDTGRGIHPTERRRIFETFYQSKFADPDVGRRGWGLGLWMAQEIVRAHHGDIGVESGGLGRGSRFWVFIPLRAPLRGAAPRPPRRLVAAAALALAVLAGASGALAQWQGGERGQLPLDEKARFDRALEEKAEGVLLKILGPNRAKVVVDSTLDFTRVESFEFMSGGKRDRERGTLFAWQNTTAGGPQDLLPGIPVNQELPGAGPPAAYERRYALPSSFVKRLVVAIILDRSVDARQAAAIQDIVSNILEIDVNRGDDLTMVRAEFAPAWKTVWYSQDSFSMVFKYSVLSLMTLITLVVVASCFLRLAGAMDAMARSQAQQYGMELGMKGEEGAAGAEEAALPGPPGDEGREAGAPPAPVQEEVRIEVRPAQVALLCDLLKAEDPDNVALVAAYLEPAVRAVLLSSLPAAAQAEVLLRISQARYVEADLVERLKVEIEGRLAGTIGGLHRVQELVELASPEAQRQLLHELELRDPEVARVVRERIFLIEDLPLLEAQEWSLLIGRTRLEDWATVLRNASEEVQAAMKSQVLKNTWLVLEQIMMNAPSSGPRVAEAQGRVLGEVRRLVEEGRLRQPASIPRGELAALEGSGEAVADSTAGSGL